MFEEILYRGHGPHSRKGGGFSTLGVSSQTEKDAALKDGWFLTLPEAIEAHDNPQTVAVVTAPAGEPVQVQEIPADDAPPTRAELEQQAAELGIKFDGRTTDAALLRKINEALAA